MDITYSDISARAYALGTATNSGDSIEPRLYTEKGQFCRENAVNALNRWEHLAATTEAAYDKALDVFEELCLNGSDQDIQYYSSFLLENMKKVRDATRLQNSIKYKNSRLKTKILTKINNRRDNVTNAISDSIAKMKHNLTSSPLTPTSNNPPDRTKNDEPAGNEGGVAEQCFRSLYEEAAKLKECDRIISNYNKISNRFNIDKLVDEAVYCGDLYQAAWDIAACMDTYGISFRKEYCCALECAKYTFDKHHIKYPSESIINGVTDYFIFTQGLNESQLEDISKVKETTPLFEINHFHVLDFLYDDDTSIDQLADLDDSLDMNNAESLTEGRLHIHKTKYTDTEIKEILMKCYEIGCNKINEYKKKGIFKDACNKEGIKQVPVNPNMFELIITSKRNEVSINVYKTEIDQDDRSVIWYLYKDIAEDLNKDPYISKVANVTYGDGDEGCIYIKLKKEALYHESVTNLDPTLLTENYGVDFGFSYFNEAESDEEDKRTTKQKMKDATKGIHAKKIDVKKSSRKLVVDSLKGNPDEREDPEVREMIDDFRKECAKDPKNKNNLTRLKGMINKLFTKTPYQIVYEIPNLFSLIRVGFIISATAVNPIIGAVTVITDQIIRLTLERKQTEKIIKAYEKEIDTVKNKIEKTKDGKTKDNLEKYLKELEKDLEKIKLKFEDLHSEEENDERHEKEEEEKYANGDYDDEDFDDEFDWDDDDWDLDDDDLEEAANIATVAELLTSINETLIDDKDLDGVVFGNVFKLDNDCIDALTDFSVTVPVILEKNKLCEALKDYRTELRASNPSLLDYVRIDCLNDNIYKLEHTANAYNTTTTLQETVSYLSVLNELTKMVYNEEYIREEMSIGNNIKLAVDRMKRGFTKLTDKEKNISRNIDASASQVAKSLERASMNDNREAVIKGSMIPSASKCIKMALGLGVAWAINPAIAVIIAIGTFACKKKMQKKERQLVLDEIDIELKMVERYIQQAENENDLEKVKQYEIMQRNLQRQQQRIKYSMHVYHDKIPAPRDADK